MNETWFLVCWFHVSYYLVCVFAVVCVFGLTTAKTVEVSVCVDGTCVGRSAEVTWDVCLDWF